MKAEGSLAVMQNRASSRKRAAATGEHAPVIAGDIPDELEFFPTPPWATRALVRYVLDPLHVPFNSLVIDPCCGEGHMVETLRENFVRSVGSDIFDYGFGYHVRDALAPGLVNPLHPFLMITNPPFVPALDLALTCFDTDARGRPGKMLVKGLFLFLRSNWIEGCERYERLFRWRPPHVIAPFVERVPLVKGRYDPNASTATAYSWFGWLRDLEDSTITRTMLIPPCRRELETRHDARRWCKPGAAPLLEGGAE